MTLPAAGSSSDGSPVSEGSPVARRFYSTFQSDSFLTRLAGNSAPKVMGILNVTPDSFSDGGVFLDAGRAIERASCMIAEGAGIVDVGAESTRPGAEPVESAEQIRRAIPVIRGIRSGHADIRISIDTRSGEVAREAIAAGANMVNDVSAFRDDPEMVEVVAGAGVDVIVMHRRGTSRNMQAGGGPYYDDLIGEISDFLCERREFAVGMGVGRGRILFDPGIGFGKRYEHNLQIISQVHRFVSLGQPVVIGASRKAFIGRALGIDDPAGRMAGSVACALIAALGGASIIRVHDVGETVQALRMAGAIGASSDV